MKTGAYDKALPLVEQAVQAAPDSVGLKLLLAQVYTAKGNLDEASRVYRDIAAQFPDQPDAALATAEMYRGQKNARKAVEVLQSSLSKHGDDQRLLMLLGEILHQEGMVQDALKAFERAIRRGIDAKTVEAYRHMGEISVETGDKGRARKYFTDYMKAGGPDKRVAEALERL